MPSIEELGEKAPLPQQGEVFLLKKGQTSNAFLLELISDTSNGRIYTFVRADVFDSERRMAQTVQTSDGLPTTFHCTDFKMPEDLVQRLLSDEGVIVSTSNGEGIVPFSFEAFPNPHVGESLDLQTTIKKQWTILSLHNGNYLLREKNVPIDRAVSPALLDDRNARQINDHHAVLIPLPLLFKIFGGTLPGVTLVREAEPVLDAPRFGQRLTAAATVKPLNSQQQLPQEKAHRLLHFHFNNILTAVRSTPLSSINLDHLNEDLEGFAKCYTTDSSTDFLPKLQTAYDGIIASPSQEATQVAALFEQHLPLLKLRAKTQRQSSGLRGFLNLIFGKKA